MSVLSFAQPAVRDLVHDAVTPVLGAEVAGLVVDLLRDIDSTLTDLGDGEAALITGDIPAVWFRDSCVQMAPFLRVASHLDSTPRAGLTAPAAAVLRRHWRMIALDPYANAYTLDPATERWDPDDEPTPGPWFWERKFELDSLAFPVVTQSRLLELGEQGAVTPTFAAALQHVVVTYETETDHESRSDYWFRRPGGSELDTLARDGRGAETEPIGLIWSGFRPSDDACELGFNVPGNVFAAKALSDAARLADSLAECPIWADGVDPHELARRAGALSAQVIAAIAEHGVVPSPSGEDMLAYEVDGRGTVLLMDDANLPSLLGLPYLDALPPELAHVYHPTRRFVLSSANPWYFEGTHLAGVGSPHTGPRRVWPIALAVQGLTTDDAPVREGLIEALVRTTNGTNHMHEGIDPDDPSVYTREWFSWANAMFCELVLAHCGL